MGTKKTAAILPIDPVIFDADARELIRRRAHQALGHRVRDVETMKRAEHRRAERALWRSSENARPAGSTRLAVGGNRDGVAWLEGDPLLMVDAWPEGSRIHV